MNHVRRFMWARRVQNGMDEWQPLDLTTEDMGLEALSTSVPEGLETDAASLQAHFEVADNHLADVRQRHTEVLVTAGMTGEWPRRTSPRTCTCLGGRRNQWTDRP